MHFHNCNWMQVEDYLKKDDRLMLVIGSTEQHGYLSLTTDSKIPLAMAEVFRKGNLGVMDFYRMQNIMADTSMRESLAGGDEESTDKGK